MEIRPTQIDELPRLSEFLTTQGMARSPEVLRWKFWQSPGHPAGESTSFVARIDGRIVGHVGILPATLHLGQAEKPTFDGGWFVDWMVRQDLRSRGIGIFLLREAARVWPTLMTIQGSADTREVLPQLNWSQNRRLAVYKLNVRFGALGRSAGITRRAAAQLARLLYYHPVTHCPPSGWQLINAMTVPADAQWDLLDDALPPRGRNPNGSICHLQRSGPFLRWSFRDHPTRRYNLLMAEDPAGAAGYAIWRTCRRADGKLEGRIVDVGLEWDRCDGWRWLISVVTAHLAAEGAAQISCLAGDDSPLSEGLRQNRYLRRCELGLWTCPQATELTPGARWHLTFADSDIDTAAEV